MTPDTISFFSDYGTRDEFVGVVKGVIADIASHARVIDITHEIPAFDVRAGSLTIARAVPYLPSGVVLAVVDPGVGTSRRAIAIEVGGGVFIGPDNGLLASGVALAGGARRAFHLNNVDYQLVAPGATFAGRDVFAPAAAHLCNGVALTELGSEIDTATLMPGLVPLHRVEGDQVHCEVTWIDHYGNCQLNVGPQDVEHLGTPLQMTIDGGDPSRAIVRSAPIVHSFGDIGGGLGLVVDSYGMLAICRDRGSAAAELDATVGMGVVLETGVETTTSSAVRLSKKSESAS
jgi:S-adenosylmethionine hydrolase